jgi:hypothetical protein
VGRTLLEDEVRMAHGAADAEEAVMWQEDAVIGGFDRGKETMRRGEDCPASDERATAELPAVESIHDRCVRA